MSGWRFNDPPPRQPMGFEGITVDSTFLEDGYKWQVTDGKGSEYGYADTEAEAWKRARAAQERRRRAA